MRRTIVTLCVLGALGCALVQRNAGVACRSNEGDFLARAQEHIAAREYWASETGDGLQAPNRKHDLRSFFEPTGVRVHDRTSGGSPLLAELKLSRVGRGSVLAPVSPGEVTHHEGRVEIRRPLLVEWYENSEHGLEQGFTLARRPEIEPDDELVLELEVEKAKASRRGNALVLTTATGRKLAYGKLAVADARGRRFRARMEAPASDRIRLVVDDADADYPLTIDPLLEATADTELESNQAGAQSGFGLASAGDVNGDGFADVLVGAHLYDDGQTDEGAVFLFLGGPNGISSGGPADADQILTGNQAGAWFGLSVASAGDVNGDGYDDVIVGARFYDDGQTDEGGAFVFHGSASGLVGSDPDSSAFRIESNQAGAELGASVASAGDVNGDGYDDVIVGCWFCDNGQVDEGEAFIYHGSASGLVPGSAQTRIESNQASARLGHSVASAGDVNADGYADVIVGADLYDVTFTDAGVAAIFLGSATGVANGTPSAAHGVIRGNQTNARMGHAVASAGDVNGDGYADVMASAQLYDNGQTDEGIVSILFGRAGSMGTQTPSTVDDGIEPNQAEAGFGEGLGTLGDVNGDGYADVAVGAFLYDAGQTDEGCVWVFYGGANGISAGPAAENPSMSDIEFCGDQANGRFGANVTGAGDVDGDGFADLLVGAYLYDAGQADEGAAFLYRGAASGIRDGSPATSLARLESDQVGAQMGHSVASAGDVNADGYADVIVGAPLYDSGGVNAGAAFVFLGSPAGMSNSGPITAHAQLKSNQPNALMGISVASAGDVNGDGYADVIVGASSYSAGESAEGAAFIFLGSSSGIADGTPATADAQLESNYTSAIMGISVASAGDVNGDGYADVIVGAASYQGGGAAFVFAGSPAGISDGGPAAAQARIQSFAGGGAGVYVASAGDVDGDGFGDVIVGAPGFYSYPDDVTQGAAFIFPGSPTGIADGGPWSAATQIDPGQAFASMGRSVASAGDVNGDGYGDVIVGAPSYDAGQSNEGAAFLYLGSPSGIADGNPATAAAQLEADQAGAAMGTSVASAGDVNGDGYADLIVGAPFYSAGQTSEGAAFVFLGSAGGIADGTPGTASAQIESDQPGARLGQSSASAGDINGDGYADVIVGAPFYDSGQSDEGAAFVLLGNSAGRPTLARQRRADGSGIAVQPWGSSHHTDRFEVEIRGSYPAGTGRVRAEFEACPVGTNFGDPACALAGSLGWTSLVSGAADALLTGTLSDLASDTLHRWRARVLYADATGALPANPAHGPWRRYHAQSVAADIRTAPLDGDGVHDAVEAAAPNDGDGNGDGVSDAIQSNVASLPDAVGGPYVTLEVSGGCSSIQLLQPRTENQIAQDWDYDYPRGLMRFIVPCASATLKFFYHGTPGPAPPYRGFGSDSQWHDFPGAVFGSQLVGGVTVATVTLALTDGGFPDITGVDGSILGVGGPATVYDADHDGYPNAYETAAPNGGDGNGDGVPDADQATVWSTPNYVNGKYLTFEISSGCTGSGAFVYGEADVAGPSQQDPNYDYPYGVIYHELYCASATLKIFLHGPTLPPSPFRNYGPQVPDGSTYEWYDFPGPVFGSQLVGGVAVSTVTLSLVDGAPGDWSGVDGVISGYGGPAVIVIPLLPWQAWPLLGVALALGARRASRRLSR